MSLIRVSFVLLNKIVDRLRCLNILVHSEDVKSFELVSVEKLFIPSVCILACDFKCGFVVLT